MHTRPLTGMPPWPLILIAGIEKSGKTYSCVEASTSGKIGDTYWIAFGEDVPDELGRLSGQRVQVVEHDGTYRGLLTSIEAVNALGHESGRPHMIVLDSATRVWDLLKDETQESAWRRAKAKADRQRQSFDKMADEVKPSMDLWNLAAQRWAHIMDALREHEGPVLITARLDEVTVIGRNDQPTGEKAWSIQGHKSLPNDVGAIVEFRAYRKALVRGVRSLKWAAAPDHLVPVSDFTVVKLWDQMGIADATARTHVAPDAVRSIDVDQAPPVATDPQVAALWVAAQRRGYDAESFRHFLSEKCGRVISSGKDITFDEASRMLDLLKEAS